MNDLRANFHVDILAAGGGTAGCAAAIKAKEALPTGTVLLLEKANVKRSGAIALGMDGVNNAVIPGHATPEQYVKGITMANDGIVNQAPVLAYAQESFPMVQELESWGVKFQKTASGDYDIKKILTRTLRRTGVKTENRVMGGRGRTGRRVRMPRSGREASPFAAGACGRPSRGGGARLLPGFSPVRHAGPLPNYPWVFRDEPSPPMPGPRRRTPGVPRTGRVLHHDLQRGAPPKRARSRPPR